MLSLKEKPQSNLKNVDIGTIAHDILEKICTGMSDDGVTFRSTWQDYRENTENDSDPLHCIYTAVLRVPRKAGRTVCIKAVDVFGFESMVTETIG